MSTQRFLPSTSPSRLAREPAHPFLARDLLRHGPLDLLESFLARAQAEALQRGVTPEFGEFSKLVSTNGSNGDCWRSLVPVLDPRRGALGDNKFCLVGLDHKGDIVATQAARLYDLADSNLKTEAEAGRLMAPYSATEGVAQTLDGQVQIILNVPSASRVTGRAVYSGGTWHHPDYRGIGLSSVLPRLGRALALAMWDVDYFFSFVEPPLARRKMLDRYGYSNVENGAKVIIGDRIDFEGSLIWMHKDELIDDLSWFLSQSGAQVDTLPRRRSA